MSDFSNRAENSTNDAGAYVEAVLKLLGGQDPIEVLASTASVLSSQIEGVPRGIISKPEASDKWSVAEVIQHLADSETVWAYRLRKVLAEDKPVLSGYDQDLWARRFRYADVPVVEALSLFTYCRAANLRLLGHLSEEDYQRVGVHSERGQETVRHMVSLYAGHDLVHLRQIDRILRRHADTTDGP